MLHFFCAIQTSDGGMEKKIRMWRAVESGGFVGNGRESRILRNALRAHPGEPERAAPSSGRERGISAQIEID